MMKLLAVAPYPGLGELIKQMTAQYPQFEITVVVADMKDSLGLTGSLGGDEYDVVISRGGTARLLAKHSRVPVVEIQVSGFDVLRMLTLMKEYQAKIRVVGFPNIIQSFVSVSNLLDYDFVYTVIDGENEVENALITAKKDGVQVIVGDTVTVRFANELGMQGVLITSGRESVAEAFRTAELMCRSLEKHKKMNRILGQVLRESGCEAAVVDETPQVLFATPGMKSVWADFQGDAKPPYPLARDGFLGELLSGISSDIRQNGPLTVYEPIQNAVLRIRNMNGESGGSALYLLTHGLEEDEGGGLRIVYPDRDLESFPSFIHSNGYMDQALRQAKSRLAEGRPVVLCGEPGTGKRIFTGALVSQLDKHTRLTEIEVRSAEEASYDRFAHLVSRAKPDTLMHIRGFHLFAGPQQRKLAEKIKSSSFKAIFSFDEPPNQLKGESRLDGKVLEWLGCDAVRLLPLRERQDELEGLVRSFLAVFNEKYGKQIVGMRPDVWNALRRMTWKENLIELRDTVDGLVRETQGEYIEPADLERLLGRGKAKQQAGHAPTPAIDLNQSLEDIERDIIRFVLEEEDMNQSKAAKRLKINRTTLWRKVKNEM